MTSLPSCTHNPLLAPNTTTTISSNSDFTQEPVSKILTSLPETSGPRANITTHANAFSTQQHQMKNSSLFNTSQFFSKIPSVQSKIITESTEEDDELSSDPPLDSFSSTFPTTVSQPTIQTQTPHSNSNSNFNSIPHPHTSTLQNDSINNAYIKPFPIINSQSIAIPQSWILHQLHLRQHQLSKIKIPLTIVTGSWNVNGKKPSNEPLDSWLFPLRSRIINPYAPTQTYQFTTHQQQNQSVTAQFSSSIINNNSNTNPTPLSSNNINNLSPSDETPQLSSPAALVVVAFQEVVALSAKNLLVDPDGGLHWQNHISDLLNKTLSEFYERIPLSHRPLHRDQYVLVAKDHLVGLSILVWSRRSLVPLISNVKIGRVGVGLMGVGGNKGAVGVSLFLGDTSLCFINAHIAAHQNKVEDRNAHYRSILQRFRFDTPIPAPISQLASLPPTYDVYHPQYAQAIQGLPVSCPTGYGPPANTDLRNILALAATQIKPNSSANLFSSVFNKRTFGTNNTDPNNPDILSMMMGDIPIITVHPHQPSTDSNKQPITPTTPTVNLRRSLSINPHSLHMSSAPAIASPVTSSERSSQTFQSNLTTIPQSPDIYQLNDDAFNTSIVVHEGFFNSPQIYPTPFISQSESTQLQSQSQSQLQSNNNRKSTPANSIQPPTPIISSQSSSIPPTQQSSTISSLQHNQSYSPHPTIPLHIVYQTASNPHQQQQSTTPDLHVLDHSHIIWLGDLNYRLNHSQMDLIFQKIEQKDITYLLSCDQLLAQKSFGRAFSEFIEMPIAFLPTYKYIPGQHLYERRPGKKIRMPSYCDRIQFRSSTTNQLKGIEYDRSELLISDHKPVRLTAAVDAHIFDRQKYQQLYQTLRSFPNASQVAPSISLTWSRIFFPQIRNNIVQTSSVQITNTCNTVIRYECIITQIDPSSLQFFPQFLKSTSNVSSESKKNSFSSHLTLFDDCKSLSRQQLTNSSHNDPDNPENITSFIPAHDPSRVSTSFPDGMIPAPPKTLDFRLLSTQFNSKPIIDTTALESRRGKLGQKYNIDGLASLWLTVTPDKGILAPGEEVTIDVKVHVLGKEGQRCQIGQLPLSSMIVVRIIDACVRQWGLESGPTCVDPDDQLWVQNRNTSTHTLSTSLLPPAPASIAPTIPNNKQIASQTALADASDDSSDEELAETVANVVKDAAKDGINVNGNSTGPASGLSKFTGLFKTAKPRIPSHQNDSNNNSTRQNSTPTNQTSTLTFSPDAIEGGHGQPDDDLISSSLTTSILPTPTSEISSTNQFTSTPSTPASSTQTQSLPTSSSQLTNRSIFNPAASPQSQAPMIPAGSPQAQIIDPEVLFWQNQSTPIEYAFFVGGTYIHSVIGTKLATLIGPESPSVDDDPIIIERYRHQLEQPFRQPYATSSQKVLPRQPTSPPPSFLSHFSSSPASPTSESSYNSPHQPNTSRITSTGSSSIHQAAPTTTLNSVLQPIQNLKSKHTDQRFHPNSIPKEIKALLGAILRHPEGGPFEKDLFQPISANPHQNLLDGYWTSHPSLQPCLLRHIIAVRDIIDTAPNGLLHAVNLYQIPLTVLGHVLVDLLQQLPEPLLPPPSHRVLDFDAIVPLPSTFAPSNAGGPQGMAPTVKREVSAVSLISSSNPDITSVSSASQPPETIDPPPGTTTITPQIQSSPLQQLTRWILSEIPQLHYPFAITLLSFFRSLIRSNRISCQQLTLILAKPLTHINNIHQPLQFCANKSASHLLYHILKEA